jgi:dihydroorotase
MPAWNIHELPIPSWGGSDLIDPHVHLRDWDQCDEETVEHGLRCAALAGFDEVFDMPNTSFPIVDETALERRLELADHVLKKVHDSTGVSMNYRLYIGLVADPLQIENACRLYLKYRDHVAGLKMFASQSTGNMGIVTEPMQRMVYDVLAKKGYQGLLAVHCEKQELFADEALHSLARPSFSETASVLDQLKFSYDAGFSGILHVCHISTKGALELVRKAKNDRRKVTCGATGHHSLFNLDHKPYLKMNPPLRQEEDRQAVMEALKDGTVDWVESDHAPHSLSRIRSGASGIPGFANSLRLFGCLKTQVSYQRLLSLFQMRICEVEGISKGREQFDRIYNSDMEELAARLDCEYPLLKD